MRKQSVIFAIATVAVVGLLGCSETENSGAPVSVGESTPAVDENSSPSVIEGKSVLSEEILSVNTADAKAHLSKFRRSVVNSRQFKSSTSEESEDATIAIDSSFQNENFAVDATVEVEDDSTYTVASAGVDGDGSAWIVQVEDETVVYSWREKSGGDWHKFSTEKVCGKKKGAVNVRVERAESMIVIFVDGKIVAAFRDEVKGAFIVKGEFTIGFDKKETGKCHCENGHVEQIGVETVDEIEEEIIDEPEDPVEEEVPDTTVEVIEEPTEVAPDEWIAEWDFNDSADVGRDATGNGHDATIGEGSVSTVDGIATFDGNSGFSVDLDRALIINEFVVEARIKPTQFGTMQNILVAEPPGRGVDGWQLRIDEGVLTVHLRDTDKAGDDWSIFPGKRMTLGEWSEVRLERSADSVKLYQDGELTVAVAYTGDLTQMRYDWSIGFDGMQQAFHNRYFIGEMDYVRFGKFNGFGKFEGSSETSLAAPSERLLVAWEFNEPSFIGLDRMANNSTHYEVGAPAIADTTLLLDGNSGLQVNLSKVFKRNTFAIETRVKPTKFAAMQNIIVAEPPGRYGDGWIVRLDDGVLTVHFRDEEADDVEWNVYEGEELALNEWTDIRVERSADSIKVFQNGVLTVSAPAKGDVSQLGYNIGIGYDAMMQALHDRFFVGQIDYIRYYGL